MKSIINSFGYIIGLDCTDNLINYLELFINIKNNKIITSYGFNIPDINYLKQINFKNRQVVVALPDSLTVQKIITISNIISESDQILLIKNEIEKYRPNNQKMNIDYRTLGASVMHKNSIDLQIVAALSSDVKKLIADMQSIKLDVIAVDIVSFAIERAVSNIYDNNTNILIIKISINFLCFYIFINGKILFNHKESFENQNQLVFLKTIKTILSAFDFNFIKNINKIIVIGQLDNINNNNNNNNKNYNFIDDFLKNLSAELSCHVEFFSGLNNFEYDKKLNKNLLFNAEKHLMLAFGLSLWGINIRNIKS